MTVNKDEKQVKRKYTRKVNSSVEQLANTLMLTHLALASVTQFNELALSDGEANALATSIEKVIAEYGIEINPKTEAIIGLLITASTIYIPRAIQISMRLKSEKDQKEVTNDSNSSD